jgi:hypothetical protein
VSSILGTAGNHKEPCQERREPGEPVECPAWPGNPGSGVINELCITKMTEDFLVVLIDRLL